MIPTLATGQFITQPHRFTETAQALLCLPSASSDPIVEAYRAGQSPNDYMLRLLLATTEAGELLLDLGCHVGTLSVAAAAVGRRVVAVDASSLHAALVQESMRANGFPDCAVHWSAIDETRKSVQILEHGIWTSVVDPQTPGTVTVPACSLDEFAAAHIHGRVAFMKMDIEGAELGAIRSGRALLAASRPVILFESNGMTLKLAGTSVQALRQELEDAGYKTFRIEGERWVYCPAGEIQPEAWVDMLALGTADQQRWRERIDWQWEPQALYSRCVEWAGLPHVNTRKYLLDELAGRRFPQAIAPHMSQLAATLAATLETEHTAVPSDAPGGTEKK